MKKLNKNIMLCNELYFEAIFAYIEIPGQHKDISDDISLETSVLVANVIPIG